MRPEPRLFRCVKSNRAVRYFPAGRGPLEQIMRWACRRPGASALMFDVPGTDHPVVRKYCQLVRRVLAACRAFSELPAGCVGIIDANNGATVEAVISALQAGRSFVLIDATAKTFEEEFDRLERCRPVAIVLPAFEEMGDRQVEQSQVLATAGTRRAVWSLGPNPLATVDLVSGRHGALAATRDDYPTHAWAEPVAYVYPTHYDDPDHAYAYTAEALCAGAYAVCKWLRLREGTRVLATVSTARSSGLTLALASLLSGGTFILPYRVRADTFWATAARSGADLARVKPELIEASVDRRASTRCVEPTVLKRIVVDAGCLPARSLLEFLDTYDLTVTQCYGTASTGGYVLGLPVSLSRREYELAVRDNVAGRELAFCNVRLEPADAGEKSTDYTGLLSVRGQTLSSGYWDGQAFRFWQTPWLRTAALAATRTIRRREYYCIQGHAGEALVIDGHRIWPANIEHSLLETFRFLEDCVVVARSQQIGQDQLCAAVILPEDADHARRSELVTQVLARIKAGGVQGLGQTAWPNLVVVVPKQGIPRDAEGRPNRIELGRSLSGKIPPGTFAAS